MQQISVIGSGTMGNGIAHVFAQYGFQVSLVDTDAGALERALVNIAGNLDRQSGAGVITGAAKQAILDRISPHASLGPGVREADLVVEAITENEAVKRQVFRELDQLTPQHAILATNTSSISITHIAAATQRPDKVVGMHFMNPVPVMKLVEVIRGKATDGSTMQTVAALARQLDKVPVEVNDAPGFVANRVLMPMINEAIFALYEGVATVESIDTVMKLGMAHPMGPLQLADFIGLDVCLSILNVLHEGFGTPKYAPCPLLVDLVAAGKLGKKTGSGFYHY
ncbi:3-hydroxybutyryl-CoA dehydrogenase [Parapedobacter lycopersici]|uniref:3-hydroxyacyl-CoA dehydrogenase family protein n=1 Tax=Parapedobacter lycopersici TaxID=1864939 RepID=UPI0033401754